MKFGIKFAFFISTLGLAISANAKEQAINPNPASFGTWQANDDTFVINQNGFDHLSDLQPACRIANQGYFHQAEFALGKELIKTIKESQYVFSDDKNYADATQKWIGLIQPEQKYLHIVGSTSCSDGEIGFIQLDNDTGLFSITAPDEYFSLAKKIKAAQ